jgi:hypothetical protein
MEVVSRKRSLRYRADQLEEAPSLEPRKTSSFAPPELRSAPLQHHTTITTNVTLVAASCHYSLPPLAKVWTSSEEN